jgi:hypothetical protein
MSELLRAAWVAAITCELNCTAGVVAIRAAILLSLSGRTIARWVGALIFIGHKPSAFGTPSHHETFLTHFLL